NKESNIIVADSGDPIPEDNREKIFEKFVQIDNSPSRKIGGTGLGLSISKAIITMHNGKIWVESNEKGNKFNFTIPSPQ
ncbi:PAS domain-containing sensor histidine kinase, partial [candidate division KSB1 bacterium]|nr:PAS domain-containing sensor histidine kinase [candidate division KSB1 bacterium]